MKFKRLIATALVTTMILTSQFTSYAVSAAESIPASPSASEEEISTVVEELKDEVDVTLPENELVQEDKPVVSEGSNDIEESAIETGKTEEELPADTLEDTSVVPALDEAEVEKSEDSDEESEIDELSDELGDTELQKSADYFTVDASGVLQVKSGVTLKEEVYIPANCVKIPANIFKNNRVVRVIHFDKYYIDGTDKYEQLLTTIYPSAFEGSAIEEIDGLPSGVTAIPNNAFLNSNLTTITFQSDSTDTHSSKIGITASNIESIGDNAFKGSNLNASVIYPACTTIGTSAFEDCSNLTEATFKIVEDIGASAFVNCSSMIRFNGGLFPTTLKTIGSDAFKNSGILLADLRSTALTGELNPNTFKNCVNLETVYLPLNANVTTIPSGCFEGCKNLITAEFPDNKDNPGIYGIKFINSEAFKNCSSLEEVNLRKAYEIGSAAFGGCTKLKTIEMYYNSDEYTPAPAPDLALASDAFVHYSTENDRKNHTMKGYETDAQVYADRHGYTFITAYDTYTIDVSTDGKQRSKVSLSKTKAREDEEIEVTIVPNSGYSLTDIKVGGLTADKVTLKSCTDKQQVFTFKMPKQDIMISPKLESSKSIAGGNIDYYFKDKNADIEHHTTSGYFTINESGEKHSLVVTNNGLELREWLFKYSSSDPTVATISDKGEVVALREGDTDIRASLIADSKKSIVCKLHVGIQKDIVKIEVKGGPGTYRGNGIICNDKRVTVGTGTVDGITYPLVQIMKSTTDIENISFEVRIDAIDSTQPVGNSVLAKTDWSSSDTTIAKIALASTSLNKNYVTVNKGSLGEALITISALNEKEKKPNEKNETIPGYEDNETKIIVRVVDNTPRIALKTVDVNAQKVHNYVPLYAVYDGKIYDDARLRLYYDANCTKECTDFDITYDEDINAVDIVTTGLFDNSFAINAKKSYSGMYLKGTFNEKYGNFVIKMPTINLTNKPLAPKYTSTNKINLFYNTTASAAEIGNVVITNNLTTEAIVGNGDTDATVDGAYLISKENYTRHKYDAKSYIDSETQPDLFNKNFSTTVVNNKITIKRRAGVDPINKDSSGKNILSGYLYVEFDGYKYPVMTAYTVPTHNTAPSYVLSMTTATANTNVQGQEYDVFLYEKGDASKSKISLSNLSTGNSGEDGLAIDLSQSTTRSFNINRLREKTGSNLIYLNVSSGTTSPYTLETPKAGKAVIRIHMDTWSDDGKTESNKYLRYNFDLKTTNVKPTVLFNITEMNSGAIKESMNKVTFNKAFTGEKFRFEAVTNQNKETTQATVIALHSLSPQNALSSAALSNSDITLDINTNKIDVEIDPSTIAKGTYTYKVTPRVQYVGSGTYFDLAPITFSVVVVEAQPKITLKNGSFKLNYSPIIIADSGTDVETTYTLSNLSSMTMDTQYSVDDTNIATSRVTKVKGTEPYAGLDMTGIATFNIDTTTGVRYIDVERITNPAIMSGFSCIYQISGLEIDGPGDIHASIAPFSVTIQGYLTTPSMTIKPTGSLDFVDRTSGIVYTASIKDVKGGISGIWLKEYADGGTYLPNADRHFGLVNTDGTAYTEGTPGNPIKIVITNPKGTYDKVTKPAGSKPIKPGSKYKLRLEYTVDKTGDAVYGFDIYITPTQKIPKLTATQNRDYLFAGENYGYDQKTMNVWLQVPKNTEQKHWLNSTKAGTAPVVPKNKLEIEWASGTPQTYKNTFDIGRLYYQYNPTDSSRTGVYTFDIKVKNAAALQQEKTYTLNLVAYYEGQASDTVGTPFQVKVNLKK